MQRYDSYKDSGVKWLGEIPSHWEVCKTKNLCVDIFSGGTPSSGEAKFWDGNIPWIPSGMCHDCDIEKAPKFITELGFRNSSTRLIPSYTTVMAMTGATCSMVGYLKFESCANQSVTAFIPKKSILRSRFLFYLLQAMRKYILTFQTGGAQGGINVNDCKNLAIPQVPHNEQEAIANYLDTATSKIDEAIAQQQKMIDLLNERKQIIINNAVTKGLDPNVKMKPSGVDWIGDIPEHWEVRRIKYIANIYGRIGFRGYNASDLVDEGDGAITLSPSNMKDNKMQYSKRTYLSWNKYYESPEIMINNGDVLFVKTGSTYGKSCLVENLPMEATINPQLIVFKEFKCNNRFLSLVLQTESIKYQVELSVIGGTIPTISQEKILNYIMPLPSEKEQHKIVEWIQETIEPIQSVIDKIKNKISLLQERKQIIINDVVTGKVKVI